MTRRTANWLAVWVSVSVLASAQADVRVALLATTLNADSEKYLDVATAELTARGSVELVERQAIRQVFGEQALALQQDASGVAAGRLLRADVVGVLETTPDGKEAGGFAVLDTATGVSYWNEGLDQTDVEAVAGEMARGVASALEKRGRAGALGTVCVLGARNAEFPRNLDVFCETVAYLLERRLVANPALATLDRRRLETVVAENNLPGVESKSAALRASLRLVELDFRRGAADGEIKVLARTTDAGGNLIAQPEVAGPQDAAALAEQLQTALAEVLHAATQVAAGNRAQEANRFRVQGKILWDRELHEAGMRAYDAAYALAPGNEKQLAEYVDRRLHLAYDDSLDKRYEAALDNLDRAIDVEERHGIPHANRPESHRDFTLYTLARCKIEIPPGSETYAEFDRLRRRYLAAVGMTDAAGTPSAAGLNVGKTTLCDVGEVPKYYPSAYSPRLRFPVVAALVLSRDADEFFRLMEVRLAPWLAREADPAQPHDAGIITTIDNLCGSQSRHVWQSNGFIPFDAAYVQGLRAMAARFRAHPRKVVQLEGAYFEDRIDLEVAMRAGEAVASETIAPRAAKLVDMALSSTESADALPAGDLAVVYEMAARAAKLIDPRFVPQAGGTPCDDELLKIAQAMFDRGHLSGAVLKTLLDSQADFEKYRLPVLKRLEAACRDPAYVWLGLTRDETKDMLRGLPQAEPSPRGTANSRLLWSTDEPQMRRDRLIGLKLREETELYAVSGRQPDSIPNHGAPLTVLRIDVESGRREPLGQIRPQTCWANQYFNAREPRGCEGDYVQGAVEIGRHLWIATSGDGLFGVPLDGVGEPIRLGMSEGLPSDVVHAVAAVGDVLYVGCGQFETEGYLAAYDLVGGRCTVLASTLRASPETPLDSLPGGFRVRGIVPDVSRERLLLAIDQGDLKPATGVWECRLGDGAIRQLAKMDRAAQAVLPGSDGKFCVYPLCRNPYRPISERGGWYGAVEWDPATDAARLVFATKNKGAGPGLPVRTDTRVFPDLLLGGALVAEGWLYHFAEIIVAGERVQEVRRVSLASGSVQKLDAGVFRGNVYQWGRLTWLPGKRILLVGDGDRLAAVKIEE